MGLHVVNNELHTVDPVVDRTQMGTVGGDHVAPQTLQAHKINQNILPFDQRVSYAGGVAGGTWTLNVNASGLYRFSTFARTTTPGSQVQVLFTGSRIEIFGVLLEAGGKFDVYIDNVLTPGTLTASNTFIPAVIPIGQQVPPTSNQVSALNATTTSIVASDTSPFGAGPGIIRIDDEWIQYTSKTATSFEGCTRGALGTVASIHIEGTPIYAVSSTVDTYKAKRAYRRSLWVGDNLSPGSHSLVLQMRTDQNSAFSGPPELRLECFATGGLLGGTGLNLFTDQTDLTSGAGSFTTNSSGNYLPGALSNLINTQQLISILGIVDDSHSVTYQIDNAGNIWLHGAPNTTYTNCWLTALYAQDTV